jgi:hypothetical protein
MIAERFIAQTRRAASRRRSLLTLAGGALTAAVPGPATASASKAGKNQNKNKKAKKRCTKQEAQCVTAISEVCAQLADPLPCERAYRPCCALFASCNVEPGFACLYAPPSTG